MLDGHIHIYNTSGNSKNFLSKIKQAGIEGGMVISLPPQAFKLLSQPKSFKERLNHLFQWTSALPRLFPCFWIDPMEDDAEQQVDVAVKKGVLAFKMICDRFFPSDKRAMKIISLIAQYKKPVLFHSGILWDGKVSSKFVKPVEFECLLEINNIRFSLAHLSWPWHDECLAVYGKFLNAYTINPKFSARMYLDTTPGTPVIYRKEALGKVYSIGYDISKNIIFGSDCNTASYNVKWTKDWITRDKTILQASGAGKTDTENYLGRNLLRFLGEIEEKIELKPLNIGE